MMSVIRPVKWRKVLAAFLASDKATSPRRKVAWLQSDSRSDVAGSRTHLSKAANTRAPATTELNRPGSC